MTAREGRAEVSRARAANAGDLRPGARYSYGPRSLNQSGTFVRYEIDRWGIPIAIFIDTLPLISDWTPETEVCVGLSGLINTHVEEA